MKKLLVITLTLCLSLCAILSLAACSSTVEGKIYTQSGLEGVGVTLTETQKDYVENNYLKEARKYSWKFKAEGKGEIWSYGKASGEFTWVQDGDKVTITDESGVSNTLTAKDGARQLYLELDYTSSIGCKVNVIFNAAK